MIFYDKYRYIYNTHLTEIPDNFLEFSIRFRCFLLEKNINIHTLNDRNIQNYIKVQSTYDLETCKKILHLENDEFDEYRIYSDKLPKIPKKKVNIIISAYHAQDFIEECLDSIANQTYIYSKILLGIDGCKDTLKKAEAIRNKYRNLHIYLSEENCGPYMMFNALISLVSDNEYLQIFGADDVMDSNMLEVMSEYTKPVMSKHCGVLFIYKDTFNAIGGFRAWRCAADIDSLARLRLSGNYVSFAPQLFYRREHQNQLTKAEKTNFESEIRKSYMEIFNNNLVSENPLIYIKPICSKIIEL